MPCVDRIETLTLRDECFHDEPGKTLADLFRRENVDATEETTP